MDVKNILIMTTITLLIVLSLAKPALSMNLVVNADYPQAGVGSNITGVYGDWPYLYGGGNTGNVNLTFNESAAVSLNVNSSNTSAYSTFAVNASYADNCNMSSFTQNASYADNSNASIHAQNASYAVNSNSSDYSNRTQYWDGGNISLDIIPVNNVTNLGSKSNTFNNTYINVLNSNNKFLTINLPVDGIINIVTNRSAINEGDVELGFTPGGNVSKIVSFTVYDPSSDISNHHGIVLGAVSPSDRVFMGAGDGLYNLGSLEIRWGAVYSQNFSGAGYDLTNVNASTLGGFTYEQINSSAIAAANGYTDSEISGVYGSLTTTNNTVNLINANYQNKSAVIANATFANTAGTFDNEIDFGAIGQSIIPSADNSINLGDGTHHWANIFIGQNISTVPAYATEIYGNITTSNPSFVLRLRPYTVGQGENISIQFYVNGTSSSPDSRIQLIASYLGLKYYTLSTSQQVFFPGGDNAYTLGTASYRWADTRSVLINGADYCFANDLCLTECVINDVQDICVVEGLPTREQAEIMGLADIKDYNDYKIRMNGTLTQTDFTAKKSLGLKNNKKDFVFSRRIITSVGKITDLEQRIKVLEEKIR